MPRASGKKLTSQDYVLIGVKLSPPITSLRLLYISSLPNLPDLHIYHILVTPVLPPVSTYNAYGTNLPLARPPVVVHRTFPLLFDFDQSLQRFMKLEASHYVSPLVELVGRDIPVKAETQAYRAREAEVRTYLDTLCYLPTWVLSGELFRSFFGMWPVDMALSVEIDRKRDKFNIEHYHGCASEESLTQPCAKSGNETDEEEVKCVELLSQLENIQFDAGRLFADSATMVAIGNARDKPESIEAAIFSPASISSSLLKKSGRFKRIIPRPSPAKDVSRPNTSNRPETSSSLSTLGCNNIYNAINNAALSEESIVPRSPGGVVFYDIQEQRDDESLLDNYSIADPSGSNEVRFFPTREDATSKRVHKRLSTPALYNERAPYRDVPLPEHITDKPRGPSHSGIKAAISHASRVLRRVSSIVTSRQEAAQAVDGKSLILEERAHTIDLDVSPRISIPELCVDSANLHHSNQIDFTREPSIFIEKNLRKSKSMALESEGLSKSPVEETPNDGLLAPPKRSMAQDAPRLPQLALFPPLFAAYIPKNKTKSRIFDSKVMIKVCAETDVNFTIELDREQVTLEALEAAVRRKWERLGRSIDTPHIFVCKNRSGDLWRLKTDQELAYEIERVEKEFWAEGLTYAASLHWI